MASFRSPHWWLFSREGSPAIDPTPHGMSSTAFAAKDYADGEINLDAYLGGTINVKPYLKDLITDSGVAG